MKTDQAPSHCGCVWQLMFVSLLINYVKLLNGVALLALGSRVLSLEQKMRRVAKELGENLGDDELQVCAPCCSRVP